jgi:hypothetical protein
VVWIPDVSSIIAGSRVDIRRITEGPLSGTIPADVVLDWVQAQTRVEKGCRSSIRVSTCLVGRTEFLSFSVSLETRAK